MTRPVKCIFCLAADTGRSRPPLILHRFRLRENASGCRSYERHGRKRELFDDKGSDIGIGCRHGHSAEDTVAFAPCDDPDVAAGILFELGTPVLGDGGTGCVGFNGSGLVPVPGSVGIRCEENVVSVAAVDNVPLDVHLQIGSGARVFGSKFGR